MSVSEKPTSVCLEFSKKATSVSLSVRNPHPCVFQCETAPGVCVCLSVTNPHPCEYYKLQSHVSARYSERQSHIHASISDMPYPYLSVIKPHPYLSVIPKSHLCKSRWQSHICACHIHVFISNNITSLCLSVAKSHPCVSPLSNKVTSVCLSSQ